MPVDHATTTRRLTLVILAHFVFGFPVICHADDPITPAPALEFSRWSGAINVPDPVAISVDPQGTVYVTQTRRRKIQDLDIRQHRQWIPADVGLTTVEQKRRFLREVLAIGGDQSTQKRHVEDHNGDGQFDWRDLTVVSERVFRLQDTSGNGKADRIDLFAEDFATEVTGIAAGVMAFGDDVWVTIAPDVWKLTDTDDDGTADQRKVMATGFGLHIAYAGHDMHGLTVGPDGRVYWSIGDKGIHVTDPQGRTVSYPNQGGVMRCEPDGSRFEVFAHGLRNVQEVAFDQYGNLFGVDNDADMPGERERFVWIVPQMDAGWRCNYQYRGDDYNPWTAEKLWQVAGDQHPAYLTPPLSYFIDGPAGFKFNPGTALSPEYKDFFFLTGAPNGNQHAFRVAPHGDAFRMVDERKIGSGTAIVGLAFGPDGALYGADWDGGYPLDQKGAVVQIDVPGAANSPIRRAVKAALAEGFATKDETALVRSLGHPDRRLRLGAQFELVKRESGQTLTRVASQTRSDRLARLHAVWGLGQLARHGDQAATESLAALLGDDDAVVRGQVAKTYGEIEGIGAAGLIDLLADEDAHVRIAAGLAIARHRFADAVPVILNQADSLSPDEHYLRHSLVQALAASASAAQLVEQADSDSEMRRICALLALRSLADPGVAAFVADPSAWVASEAARAIHDDLSIPGAMTDLAESLNASRELPEAHWRRAVNANFRLGDTESARRLIRVALDADRPLALRVDVCKALADWRTPPSLDRVDGRNRAWPATPRVLPDEEAGLAFAQLAGSGETKLQIAAMVASRKLGLPLAAKPLRQLIESKGVPAELRVEALNSIADSKPTDLKPVIQVALESDQEALVVRAIELSVLHDASGAISNLRQGLKSRSIPVRQAAIAGLAKLASNDADRLLQDLVDQATEEKLDRRLWLDLDEATQARADDVPSFRQPLPFANPKGSDTKLGRFYLARDGGDPVAGELLFRTHVQAQCSRCHRIGKEGSEIGPELTKIAKKRDADYLLRSVVRPSDDIEPQYLMQSLLLASGQIVKGVILSEDDDFTVVGTSDGKELKIESEEIEAISGQKVSLMPDMTETLRPREVRDLVAYLRTLK